MNTEFIEGFGFDPADAFARDVEDRAGLFDDGSWFWLETEKFVMQKSDGFLHPLGTLDALVATEGIIS